MLEERIVVGIFVAVVSPSLTKVLKSLWFLMHDTSHCLPSMSGARKNVFPEAGV